MLDSKDDARAEIWAAINSKQKWRAIDVFEHILAITESDSKRKAVERSRDYILDQWTAIINGVKNRKDKLHCSAEGHISHCTQPE